MSKYKKLISNTLILAAGTFASKVIVFLMMPFYTLVLSPEQFGVADIVSQTAKLIIPIACVGICDGLFRFALDAQDRKKVFSTGMAILSLGSIAVFILLPLLSTFSDLEGYVLLIGAYVLCANFHSACAQYIRALGKTTLFAVQGIVNTALTVALNVLFLLAFDLGAYGYVLSVVVADLSVTVAIFFAARLYRDISVRALSRTTAKELLKFSVPYIPTTMLWLVISASDRYIVNAFDGMGETGLYAAAYKIPTLLTIACTVFVDAWQFSAVKDTDDEGRAGFFGKVFGSYQGFVFLAASVLVIGSRFFTRILLADSYYESWQYVPVLVVATVFSTLVSFMGSVYFVEKKSVLSMMTALMGAIINVVLNFVMIPDHGAMGAAVATLISYLAVYVVRAYDTRRYVRFDLHTARLIINTALIFMQMAALYINVRYSFAAQVLIMLAIIVVNGKDLLSTLREFASFLPIKRKKAEKKD